MARLTEHVKWTDLSLNHHIAFWNAVEAKLPPGSLEPTGELGSIWKASVAPKQPPPTNPLKVPYYSQRDSTTPHALRMCFSSSCAMLLETIKPGTLAGPNGDDAYLGRVLRYGDTTDPQAQLKALASYGVTATFTQRADWRTIEQQIKRGVPVPCGFLHKGHVSAPGGGGHWLCAIGYDDTALIVHDPFGEVDLVSGIYRGSNGASLRYSRKNFAPRWMVEGAGTGWAIIANI
jgi:hypothetical protein